MKNLILLLALAAIIPAQAGSTADALQSTLDKYILIQSALAGDSLKGVPEATAEISAIAKASVGVVPEAVAGQADALAKATDITAAREAFMPLSDTMIAAISVPQAVSGQYYQAFCPMAKASWIQTGKEVSNPYFGKSMSKCGEIQKSFGGASLPKATGGAGCCGS